MVQNSGTPGFRILVNLNTETLNYKAVTTANTPTMSHFVLTHTMSFHYIAQTAALKFVLICQEQIFIIGTNRS